MTRTQPRRRSAAGSALILVMMLLMVMSLIAVTVVTMSSQGRINAAAQSSHDALVECANAAQAQLWAAVAANGKVYATQPSTTMVVVSLTLPDGRELRSPAHLDSDPTSTPSQGVRGIPAGSPTGFFGDIDQTNTFAGSGGTSGQNTATWVTARCRDTAGRVHEVEFAFRFAL